MTLTILAVDPATTTGWACSDGTSGAESFASRRYSRPRPEPEEHGFIGDMFECWLNAKLTLTQAGVLLVEKPMVSAKLPGALRGSAITLGLRMIALMVGWRRNLLVEEVWESQWKPRAKAGGTWVKGDQADAKEILGWWIETRLPLVEAGPCSGLRPERA